jgi:hypothetical protein
VYFAQPKLLTSFVHVRLRRPKAAVWLMDRGLTVVIVGCGVWVQFSDLRNVTRVAEGGCCDIYTADYNGTTVCVKVGERTGGSRQRCS